MDFYRGVSGFQFPRPGPGPGSGSGFSRLLLSIGLKKLSNLISRKRLIFAILASVFFTVDITGMTFKPLMSDYGILANKTVTIIIICVATSCIIWRSYAAYRKNCCKVIDASKGNYSRSDDDISFSLSVKDRLSELPFEVLSQILSHFSIREVARMATLSRHWKNVCLALPLLDLDWYVITGTCNVGFHTPKCEPHAHAYVKNVDQVLKSYRCQNIQSFHLSCCLNNKIYGGDIDRWMSFVAAYKGLQSLSLQFICEDNWRKFFNRKDEELHLVSGSFLSQFTFLKSLHLDACILRPGKEFKLSNLTTLDLNNVILEGSQWQGVFSCSSTINCLWLRGCKLPSKLCIGNNFPCLRFLMIGGCSELRELEVSASKLQKFDLHTPEDIKCTFFNVPSLERVYLFPLAVCCVEDILNNLAAKLPGLKYLFLRGKHSLMHKLPSGTANLFYSVSSLRISMNIDDGNILSALPCLLKSFPQLKELEIKLPQEPRCKMSEFPVPLAHTKLEYIEIFELQVQYIPVAIYLLKSAGVLNRMVVTKASKGLSGYENLRWFYIDRSYSDEERLVIQKALNGKAASTNVELIVK